VIKGIARTLSGSKINLGYAFRPLINGLGLGAQPLDASMPYGVETGTLPRFKPSRVAPQTRMAGTYAGHMKSIRDLVHVMCWPSAISIELS